MLSGQKLQSTIVQLRKVCNHPFLFHLSDDHEAKLSTSGSLPDILAWSGKMLLLHRMIPALLKRNHKILIFSQMTKMLDILADYCTFIAKVTYCRIDGLVKYLDRQDQIDQFNSGNIPIFLLSTRAGGLGINLTAADTVIIFDSDWNPQADLQAQDRVHRIGQTKPVVVYRLATFGTVECDILDKASTKRILEKLVIHKGKSG